MNKIINLQNFALTAVFLLPMYLIRLKVFNIPLNALDVLTGVFILLFFLFERKKTNWEEIKKKYYLVLILFGIILSCFLVSTVLNGTWAVSLGLIKSWIVLPFAFSFLAIQVFPKNKRGKLLKAYFFSCLTVSILALGYYFAGEVTYDGRLRAFFGSPNYLAMYLIPGFLIGLVEVLQFQIGARNKFFYIVGLVLIGIAVYLTKSYASWATFLLTILIAGIVFLRERIKLGVLVVLFFMVAIFSFQRDSEKFQNLASLNDRSSLASRVMIWEASTKLIQDNWFWGVGLGNFQNKYLEYQKYFPPYLEWAVPHPHNIFLAFWLYSGFLGLISFLALIFIVLRCFWMSQNKKTRLASLAIVVYFILHGLVDTTYFKNDMSVIFWINFLLLL